MRPYRELPPAPVAPRRGPALVVALVLTVVLVTYLRAASHEWLTAAAIFATGAVVATVRGLPQATRCRLRLHAYRWHRDLGVWDYEERCECSARRIRTHAGGGWGG